MEAAIGAASGLIDGVVKLLSNELVEAFVASTELGLNADKIKTSLFYAQDLLQQARQRGTADDRPGLKGLVQQLSAKADEAEDALDELHYFMIQDQLDGTKYAVPDLGDDLRGQARHGRHALRHAVGNCIACFSCSPTPQDHDDGAAAADASATGGNNGPADMLSFDRVAMSKKIKLVIEQILPLCDRVSELLKINPPHASNTPIVSLKRPVIGSTTTQDTLYGRRNLFEQTIKDIITSATNSGEKLSVLPIVGPGGIGKTTFAQFLYNDKSIKEHFSVRVWICVSTDFDVLKISQQILSCMEGSNNANQTTILDQLQISIAENIKSKRFLIVFDDIWECNREDWENLLAPFIKGGTKGNMVLVTTRFPSKAEIVKTANTLYLKGLEDDDFFTFFEALIFDGKKPEDFHLELTNIARNIAKKLKGSPLAAKTVGRLLRKDLSQEHWMGVLQNNKWQKQENPNDIMASLRISYDYLPFHLKKCFPYFALFPEDYRFRNLEMTHFWIAIGIIDEDENYMEELVDNGFLMKENDRWGEHYVMHDLLHELSQIVSSQECLNINSTVSFRADAIPKSIRHLSITMEDRYEDTFRREMVKLRSKIDIVNLRALMIFRAYGEPIGDILKDTFKEIEGLRVLLIGFKSIDSLSHNFSKLIHLRFLKISRLQIYDLEVTLPSTLSRFYHLILLDLSSWYPSTKLPKDISRLISLRHFVARKELHSNVPAVGKMKCLKELKEFCVKKESHGFELSELGALTELGGELRICNLENVATKEEALNAKLLSKGGLKKLTLVWGGDQQAAKYDVLDGLEPHPNLQALGIVNHGGSTGPSWFCGSNISTMMLTSLHLEGVSWVDPPFGRLMHLTSLTLKNIAGLCQIRPGFGGVTDRSFLKLKKIGLHSLPGFTEWVGSPDAQTFSWLEEIRCSSCPNLCSLPFLQESSAVTCNHLTSLTISECPMLFLPPMPHTCTLTEVDVKNSPVGEMSYNGIFKSLSLNGYITEVAWHSMAGKVEEIRFQGGSKIPWAELPKLTSLRVFEIKEEPSFLSMALLSNLTSLTSLELIDCENLTVDGFNPLIAAVNLKQLIVYNTGRDGPRSVTADLLSELVVASRTKLLLPAAGCFRLETLDVDCISAVLAAPVCSLFATTLHKLYFSCDQRVESFTEEEENALQLLASLQTLCFWKCPGLPSLPQGLHSLSSLRELYVHGCPEIRSLPKGGLPTSLRILYLSGCPEIRSLPAEGLPTSLQELFVRDCSPELQEQAKELQGTKPDVRVRW